MSRIVVAASGSFIAPAVVLAHLCSIIGLPAQLEDRSGVNLGAAVAHLGEDDCLVAINLWRQTTDLVSACKLAYGNGVTVVAITDTKRGIAQNASQTLLVPSESASFFQSTVAAMAVVYGLIAELSAELGPDAEEALRKSQDAWDAMGSLGPLSPRSQP
jgi:DNA-binding MurR/RpiR family transcriptional regulator